MLPAPTRDDLRDEITALTAHLMERHGLTLRGIRKVAKAALRTGRVRETPVRSGMWVASTDELLADLETAVIELGLTRSVNAAIARGAKLYQPS